MRYNVSDYRHPDLVAEEASAIDGIMPLTDLHLPRRVIDELRNAGIHSIEQINYLSENELYGILRVLGCRAVDLILERRHGAGSKGVTMHG